jgi:hypothetical protein
MKNQELLSYQYNVTSQGGEDGIIEEICNRLNIRTGYFVEFGAWDGKYLSNTYNLLRKGWRGLYIEGDEQKYLDLLNTKKEFPRQIETICAFVDYEGENTLDNILSRTATPKDFELISIDIDSYDWQVWYSLCNYHPKIVVIEGNTEVPPGVWQINEDGVTAGASFTALVSLGEYKGYKLVCHNGNLFFVKKELVGQLKLNPVHLLFPETLFNYRKHLEELKHRKKICSRIRRIIPPGIKKPLKKLKNNLTTACRRIGFRLL